MQGKNQSRKNKQTNMRIGILLQSTEIKLARKSI